MFFIAGQLHGVWDGHRLCQKNLKELMSLTIWESLYPYIREVKMLTFLEVNFELITNWSSGHVNNQKIFQDASISQLLTPVLSLQMV